MSTYTATVALSGGNLTVTRPHPAPQSVDDVIAGLVYRFDPDADVPSDPPITSIGITIVTDESATASPPLQDPIPGTDTSGPVVSTGPGTPPPDATQVIPAQAPDPDVPPSAAGPLSS